MCPHDINKSVTHTHTHTHPLFESRCIQSLIVLGSYYIGGRPLLAAIAQLPEVVVLNDGVAVIIGPVKVLREMTRGRNYPWPSPHPFPRHAPCGGGVTAHLRVVLSLQGCSTVFMSASFINTCNRRDDPQAGMLLRTGGHRALELMRHY